MPLSGYVLILMGVLRQRSHHHKKVVWGLDFFTDAFAETVPTARLRVCIVQVHGRVPSVYSLRVDSCCFFHEGIKSDNKVASVSHHWHGVGADVDGLLCVSRKKNHTTAAKLAGSLLTGWLTHLRWKALDLSSA